MRRCKIPPASCRHKRSTPCCKDCHEADCKTRCQNDPAWCGCWEDKPPRKKRAGQNKTKIDQDKIFRLHQQGLSQRQIAGRMGCCLTTVNNALREMGVRSYGKS